MILRQFSDLAKNVLLLLGAICLFASTVQASYGDKLPEFRNCVQVCERENCLDGKTTIPVLHRLLFWTCPAECDYICQHIITDSRVASGLPIVQFHGKWPFYRFLGMQEPASVLFSLLNFLTHYHGLQNVLTRIPASYSLRKYYVWLAYFGMVAWFFSMIFHTRDFALTEQLDYFGAGANVLYGLYYTPIRVFRLDKGGREMQSVVRAWTVLCIAMYAAHVTYLKWYSWDYTYNMAANVVVGIIQNAMWSWFSISKYRQTGRLWAAWPGLVVAWVVLAMSLELLDFPPIWGTFDAHSLWHLGTVAPAILFYNFLLRDSHEVLAGEKGLKA